MLPPDWRGASKVIFLLRDEYEPELQQLERILSAGKVFIDVGANLEIYSLVGSHLVDKAGQVIAIEPTRSTSEALEQNIRLNSISHITLLRIAASDQDGHALLLHHPDSSRNALGLFKAIESAASVEEVKTRTLDGLIEELGLDRVDLIKIDVEGAEELVLPGARQTLARWHPTVFFEINPAAARNLGLEPDGAWELLRFLGYKFARVSDRGTLIPVGSPAIGGNVVATRHEEAKVCKL